VRRAFEQGAASTGPQRAVNGVVVTVQRKHENRGPRTLKHGAGGREAVDLGHLDVDHDDVRLRRAAHLEYLAAGGRDPGHDRLRHPGHDGR
jgi:hypothetical protein